MANLTEQAEQQLQDMGLTEPTADTRAVQQSEVRDIAILADLDQGLTYRAAAAKHGVSLSTVGRIAAKLEGQEAAARKYMANKALQAAEDWLAASAAAAKKGNHLPAKALLLHTGVIDPLQNEGSGAKVQVIVGVPGSPLPQVVDAQVVSNSVREP